MNEKPENEILDTYERNEAKGNSDSSGKEQKSFRKFLKNCLNLGNLLIFVFLFSTASFNYYLINFYIKYIPGNIYTNTIASATADSIGNFLAGFVVLKLGAKNSLCTTLAICGVSGVFLFAAEAKDWLDAIPIIVLTAKFGIAAAFGMLYMSTLQYFPSEYMGTIFGICNVTARSITILSPMVAEASDPTPQMVIIVSCLLAAFFTQLLRTPAFKNIVDESKVDLALKKHEKLQLETNSIEQPYTKSFTASTSHQDGTTSHREIKLELDLGNI